MLKLSFPGPTSPIVVAVPSDVAEALTWVLPGWFGRADRTHSEPSIRVSTDGDGYVIAAKFDPTSTVETRSRTIAATTVGHALTTTYIAQQRDLVQFHGAANLIGGQTVALIGPTLGGKSTLSLMLANLGHRLIADDRFGLKLSATEGACSLALGVAPKMRLPLPPRASAGFAAFIHSNTVTVKNKTAFLNLPRTTCMGLGDLAPIGALIFLQRAENQTAILRENKRRDIMQSLLEETLAPHLTTMELIDRLKRISLEIPGYSLSFSDSAQAANLISDQFGIS